jgi:hypothetical protein
MVMDEGRLRAAHHEAGHATVSWLLGLQPYLVSIRANAKTEGRMSHGPAVKQALAEVTPRTLKPLVNKLVKVSLAGMLGEGFYVHGERWNPLSRGPQRAPTGPLR